MQSRHLLREQVSSELKKTRSIIITLFILSLLYLAINIIFNDTGWLRYRGLKNRKAALERDLRQTAEKNRTLHSTINSYKKDDFFVEKHAREEFGLAGQDEYIFIYKE